MLRISLLFSVCLGFLQFANAQTISSFPYSQNFDSQPQCGTSAGTNCPLIIDWMNNDGDDNVDWTASSLSTTTSDTGPGGDHTPGNGNGNGGMFMYIESSTSGIGNPFKEAHLESPYFNFTSLLAPRLGVWYHMYGLNMGDLYVDARMGSLGTWTVVDFITDNQDLWQYWELNLDAFGGQDSIQIRFRGVTGNGARSDMAIDDITVFGAAPYDLGVIGINGLPQSDCGLGTANVTVEILNEGFFALNAGDSVEVTYSDGFNLITESIILAATFNPQDTLTYTFLTAADFSTTGAIYNSQAWTMYAADSLNTSNDTLMGAMVQHIPTISSFPYNEDFENGEGGWTADNTTNGSWAFGTPLKQTIFGAASGANAWTTGGLGQGLYNADEQSWVRSPCFDFSNVCDPKIEMDVWWVTEQDWDGANLQASTDGGQTWQLVGNFGEAFNWYNNNATNASPGGFSETWSGGGQGTGNGSGTWVTVRHSLAGLDSLSSVSLRVSFGSDNVFHDDGFAFDNVRIFDGVNLSDNYPTGLGLCAADSIEINVSGGVNDAYNWSTGSSDSAIWVSTAGNYSVTVTSTDGCVNVDTLVVVAGAPITVDLGLDTVGGCGQYIMDAGVGYTSYAWSTGSATQMDTVGFNGWYSVTVSNATGCTAEDSVFVEIYFDPFIDLGADIATCLIHTIDAGGGFVSYLWSNGDTTQQSMVSSSDVYTVSATNTDGCMAVDSVFVDITGVSTVDLGQDTSGCSTYTINAGTDPDTYLWSTGDTTASITVTSSGVYTIEASADGCPPAFDTINIVINTPPSVNIGQDTSICVGTVLDLDAGGGFVSYLWSTGSTQQTVMVTNPTVYSVTVTDVNGCIGNSNSILLQNLPTPVVDLGQDTSICQGDSIVLDAGSTFDTYLWSNGNTTPKTTVSQTGGYSVTVTDANTCEGVDSIFVTIDTCVNVLKHESVYEFTVFPNPSQGFLNVEVEQVDVQVIRVYDVYGRLVYTHWVQDPKQMLYNLDLNALESGQYWLSIETKEGLLNKSFIKID